MGSWFNCTKGDALGRICKVFKLPWGKQPVEDCDEVPVRWVTIREAYWIAVTELTNAQYERFDSEHGRSEFSPDDDSPVVDVSFEEAKAYCAWLSRRSGLRARLPSEAEWENACRAGSRTEYCFGDDEAKLGEYAWFDANSGGRAHAAGTKRPNAWGLYDLHGNVWEWCEDRWHDDYEGAP
ncbi:MAG: formylglycine-generating enzyme family protein, partial [Planctomycetes bacterium]|nr:formylglycine-generating enzyme family protein [Planctomycetota bacterium]